MKIEFLCLYLNQWFKNRFLEFAEYGIDMKLKQKTEVVKALNPSTSPISAIWSFIFCECFF